MSSTQLCYLFTSRDREAVTSQSEAHVLRSWFEGQAYTAAYTQGINELMGRQKAEAAASAGCDSSPDLPKLPKLPPSTGAL